MSIDFEGQAFLVTGGCGFIGSYVVDYLVEREADHVIVIDNLSAGTSQKILQTHIDKGKVTFLRKDIRTIQPNDKEFEGIHAVYHFAAQPSVPVSVKRPYYDFSINVEGTIRILDAMRAQDVPFMIFAASGGTMYGERGDLIADEQTSLRPINNYGAAKAAAEMYLSSFAHLYDLGTISLRFGNIYGPRSTHGVMYDFFHKLKSNPHQLEILGNGKQEKTYLYISDLIEAMDVASRALKQGHFEAFNISNPVTVTVDEIARLMVKALNLKDVEFLYTGGERGWPGDVKKIKLGTSKINSMGWKPKISIEEGIKLYVDYLRTTETNGRET